MPTPGPVAIPENSTSSRSSASEANEHGVSRASNRTLRALSDNGENISRHEHAMFPGASARGGGDLRTYNVSQFGPADVSQQ